MIRIGTDCSGIGAPEQAFSRLELPHKRVFACDVDKYVKQVQTEIYKPEIFYDDLMSRDNSTAPKVDLYVAGFPCQAFSIAGKRKGFDDVRGSVFFGVADYIRQAQPDVFILENVKGLLSHDQGRTVQTITDLLSNCGGTHNGQMALDFFEDGLGYHIYTEVLNTKEHGVPQNRERWFCVGFKKPREFRFPLPEPLETRLKDILEPVVDEKYFLSEKMIQGFTKHKEKHDKKGTGFGFKPKQKDDVGNALRANSALAATDNMIIEGDLNKGGERGRVYSENTGHIGALTATDYKQPPQIATKGFINQNTQASQVFGEEGISPTLGAFTHGYSQGYVKTHNLLPRSSKSGKGGTGHLSKDDGTAYCLDTGNTNAIELRQIGHTGEKSQQAGRIYSDDVTPCLTAQPKRGSSKESTWHVIDNKIRRLTPLECFRLQDFPDDFHQQVKDLGISDTQRYKMAGNSMTVRVIEKILRRIYNA